VRIKLLAALTALVAAAGLTSSAPPAVARGVAPPNVGVQSHVLWDEYDSAARTKELDKLAEAHVGWIRLDIGWATLEQAGKGKINQWYVDRINSVVTAARARGIQVLGMLWNTPKWANGGQEWIVPPKDVNDYARIARLMAQRFKGRIAAWEVWNEPSSEFFWAGDAKAYVSLVKAAYPAFKAGDPKATVVVGGTVYNDDKWLKEAYDAGLHGSFDAISTHPYMGPSNAVPELIDIGTIWRMDHVRAVHQLMVDEGDGDKPIWFTEFGWSTHGNVAGAQAWEIGVTDEAQADLLVRALTQIAGNYPYVTHVFWYVARDVQADDLHKASFGLLRRDFSAKPAYVALKTVLDPNAAPSTTTSTTLARGVVAPPVDRPAPLTRRFWWVALLAPLVAGLALARAGRRRSAW
jgi:hypothetical protein